MVKTQRGLPHKWKPSARGTDSCRVRSGGCGFLWEARAAFPPRSSYFKAPSYFFTDGEAEASVFLSQLASAHKGEEEEDVKIPLESSS